MDGVQTVEDFARIAQSYGYFGNDSIEDYISGMNAASVPNSRATGNFYDDLEEYEEINITLDMIEMYT